jgi:hypothetical protein
MTGVVADGKTVSVTVCQPSDTSYIIRNIDSPV